MLIAYRSGGAEELIPLAFRERYARAGYRFREAPAGLAEVSTPVPLASALPATSSVSSSAEEAGLIGPGPVSSAPPDVAKKRGRR